MLRLQTLRAPRAAALAGCACRCLSSSVQPVTAAGSWGWDAASIERRVSSPRRAAPLDATGAPLGRSGLCRGQPSEEDVYAAAGAPGYEGAAAAAPAGSAPAPAAAAPAAAAAPPPPLAAAGPGASAAAPPLGQVVRLTRGIVAQKNLTSFLSTWRLLALPVYAALPGCTSARVLLGESEDAAERSTRDPGPRGSLKTVVVATEWRSAEDLAALTAGAGPGLASEHAMKQLALHFRGELTVHTLGQEAVHCWQRG